MFDLFNYETKKLCETNQDLRTYIDSCHKEPERSTSYPEQSTAHFNIIENITADSFIITPQKKQNGR